MITWDAHHVQHLHARCLFGSTSKSTGIALSYNLEDYVEKVLLAPVSLPAPPGDWINEEPSTASSTYQGQLISWWLLLLLQSNTLQEKMVLFWHNHFVSEMLKVWYPQHMYWQNYLFRQHALGNFKTLTKAITTNAAMLIYLDAFIIVNLNQMKIMPGNYWSCLH